MSSDTCTVEYADKPEGKNVYSYEYKMWAIDSEKQYLVLFTDDNAKDAIWINTHHVNNFNVDNRRCVFRCHPRPENISYVLEELGEA